MFIPLFLASLARKAPQKLNTVPQINSAPYALQFHDGHNKSPPDGEKEKEHCGLFTLQVIEA